MASRAVTMACSGGTFPSASVEVRSAAGKPHFRMSRSAWVPRWLGEFRSRRRCGARISDRFERSEGFQRSPSGALLGDASRF